MRFTKMHGLGNDYVYVNTMTEKVINPSKIAEIVSDRHFGIGSDGLILIGPSQVADVKMEMYNADGTIGLMCGNGIRCVAKYVRDHGIVGNQKVMIETKSGIKETNIFTNGDETYVRVNMGKPTIQKENMVIAVDGKFYRADYISMGNPHGVVYVEDTKKVQVEQLGPKLEYHPDFQERVNVEFIHVPDKRTIQMRVWERGAGETFACGTGACAAAVSGVLSGLTESEVNIKLLGGDLLIKWSKEDGNVYMTGPAVTVFEGEINI